MTTGGVATGEDLGLRIAELIQELRRVNEQLLAEVAERRQAEDALRRGEETIRALLNAPTDTALLIDTEGTVLALNETAIRRLHARGGRKQRDGADLVGRNVYDIFPGELSRLRKARNDAVVRSGKPARYVDEREGRWFDHSIYPVRGNHGDVAGLAVFSRDITEAKWAEEALRQSRETVHALLNAPTDAALLIDGDGAIQALNETAAQRLAAYASGAVDGDPESLLGRCVYDFFPPELVEQRKSRNDDVVRTGQPARYEDERRGNWFDNSIYPVFDARGGVAGLAVFTRDITDLKRAEEAFRHMAFHDSLTGLPNRAAFESRFEAALRNVERSGRGLAVMCLDLDRFKRVNDTLGHLAGDRLLQAVGQRLSALIREGDTAARLGGDEFVLILPGVERKAVAAEVARRVIKAMGTAFEIDGQVIETSTSIGVSFYPSHGHDRESLVRCADAAMYDAKQRGRNNCRIYTPRMKPVAAVTVSPGS